ncbi:hypothetical protein [Polyangium aurulentum]|uniref:hypothetical protein n=1 Tax=Polyangium aurulentum TaxID=2567896 RepID=UPI0010AE46E3|nr:hypothetical protein [Polyangium aurulentum]UQA62709.1 hypothetical protein E8A73_020550 [Polyangium aurulentum]
MFTMLLGQIEAIDDMHVSTRFFSFIGPIFPLGTMFITNERFERRGNRSVHHYDGRPLPLSMKSVILGYLRVWLLIGAVAWPFISMWGESIGGWRNEYIVSIALLVIWLFVVIVPGRLSEEQRRQLRVLEQFAGLPINPVRLASFDRENRREVMAGRMKEASLSLDPAEALRGVESVEKSQLGLVYAYARYAGGPAWGAVADASWKRLHVA